MLYQKKYLSEGLIRMAILLSLCGVWMNVELEPYLPHTLFDMIQGRTTVQTEVHNHLDNGENLNPKNVDLDKFFTTRRLLGWVRSLDRLQIPRAEVETWLVQRESDPFPVRHEDQFFLLEERRNHMTSAVEPRPLQEENEEEELLGLTAGRHLDSESQHVPPDGSSMDLEDQWEDLLAILEAENINSRPDGNGVQQPEEQSLLTASNLLRTRNQSELGSALLPSSELDSPVTLPTQNSFVDFDPEDNLNNAHMHLLFPDLVDTLTPENFSEFDFSSHDPFTAEFMSTLEENELSPEFLGPSSAILLDEQDAGAHCSPLGDLCEDLFILDPIRGRRPAQGDRFSQDMTVSPLDEGSDDPRKTRTEINRVNPDHSDGEDDTESNSVFSPNTIYSPTSPCVFEGSSSSSGSSSSVSEEESIFSENEEAQDFFGLEMEVEVTIKKEDVEEEFGAVGGSPRDVKHLIPVRESRNPELFAGLSRQEYVGHDHTYNQVLLSFPSVQDIHAKPTKAQQSSCSFIAKKFFGRDDQRARTLKIPFSNQLIVSLPVEEFNDLLSRFQLNEEQLSLVRDIRRRGKNKIAAQNCRKRKQDVLTGLKDDVLGLRRHRFRLLKERKEALRKLREMKNELETLCQEISKYRNEEGKPLCPPEHYFNIRSNDGDAGAVVDKNSKKSRRKKYNLVETGTDLRIYLDSNKPNMPSM